MTVLKLFLYAVTAVVLYPLVKSYAPQIAPVLAIGVSLGILLLLGDHCAPFFSWWSELGRKLNGDAFSCLVKAAGIAVCADWCCRLCKDNGLTAVGGCIDVVGRLLMIAAALPLLQEVCVTLMQFAG